MHEVVAGVTVPGSPAAAEATRIVAGSVPPLLFHHSRRVYFFASLHAAARRLEADPELLYMAAIFHDTGLVAPFGVPAQRFEMDGADKARVFLSKRGFEDDDVATVWQAIALHTTPAIPTHMSPVIAATNLGVLTDVVGFGLDELDPDLVAQVVARHPRGDFKAEFPRTYFEGQRHRPETTYGTVNADVIEHFMPDHQRTSMIERIQHSAWTS